MCTLCKKIKGPKAFGNYKPRQGYSAWCDSCKAKRLKEIHHARYDPQKHREAHLRNSFDGMTQAVYDVMLAEQGGVCACCGRPESSIKYGKAIPLAIDHCHRLGAVRGLLCAACNGALGALREDPARVMLLLKYIEERCL